MYEMWNLMIRWYCRTYLILMDQEIIPRPSGNYESRNPIEKSELQICKSKRKCLSKWSYETGDYVFLLPPKVLDEPISVTEALSSLKEMNSYKWRKKNSSPWKPTVCDLVGFS